MKTGLTKKQKVTELYYNTKDPVAEIQNPHFHMMAPIRPIETDGKWGMKQRRVYELDDDGNRLLDADGNYIFNAVPTTDWGSPETLEYWREQ